MPSDVNMTIPYIKLEKITYEIQGTAFESGHSTVTGFAIDFGLPVRICIRQDGFGWRIDDFDTGFCINPAYADYGFMECLHDVHTFIKEKLENGTWDKAQKKAIQILKETGVIPL